MCCLAAKAPSSDQNTGPTCKVACWMWAIAGAKFLVFGWVFGWSKPLWLLFCANRSSMVCRRSSSCPSSRRRRRIARGWRRRTTSWFSLCFFDRISLSHCDDARPMGYTVCAEVSRAVRLTAVRLCAGVHDWGIYWNQLIQGK